MKVFLTKFHYKKKYNFADMIICAVLFVPSLFYGAAVAVRNFLYKTKIIKPYKSGIYTISVGNLTTGGTGKTPVTAEISKYLSKEPGSVAILSRGYGGRLKNDNVNVISDGKNIYFNAEEAGDEPFWLASNCPFAAVLTCASRIEAAKHAFQYLNCKHLILDDGFQHQKLFRDLNILVVDSQKQFSNGHVLPLGALRESVKEIERADKIVVVNKNFDKAEKFAKELEEKYQKPVFICDVKPSEIYNVKSYENLQPGQTIIAFSAIAQPEQFYNFLKKDYNLVFTKDYPDHHIYTIEDVEDLKILQKKYDANAIVTTEKDAVKLNGFDVFALRLKPELDVKGLLDV
jgi:tetraacyldisaccharide 4'-kinase